MATPAEDDDTKKRANFLQEVSDKEFDLLYSILQEGPPSNLTKQNAKLQPHERAAKKKFKTGNYQLGPTKNPGGGDPLYV